MNGNFHCPYNCEFKSSDKAAMVNHMEESGHNYNPLINCPLCFEVEPFTSFNDLRQHLSDSHNVLKQGGECLVCEKIFLRFDHCRDHMMQDHGMR